MNTEERIATAIAMMILLGLMLGCVSHSAAVARAREAVKRTQEVKIVTREQVKQLAQLSDNATKEDAVAILGQPNFDSGGAGDQRSAMIQALGEDYVYQYVDTVPTENSWGLSEGVTLHYRTAQMVPGKPLSSLTVFLRNKRIDSYHWLDSSQLLPEADLAKVKPLMKVVSRRQLQESLGLPNRLGGFKHCIYAFQPPASVAALGLDALEARWEGDSQNELKFVGFQPGISWAYEEMDFSKMSAADREAMVKAGRQTLERMQKKQNTAGSSPQASRASMVTEYHALLERELVSHGHIESSQWVERSQGVLKKLQPLLPNNFGPIRLVVLQSNAFNACAMRRGRDITLILYAGLLEHLVDDHELAFVVAHELSHIRLGHLYVPLGYMLQNWGGVGPLASNFYRWSQADEHGADLMAAQLVAGAGFNPSAGLSFLAKAQERNPPPAELRFSTHPEHEARRIMLNWYLDFLELKQNGRRS
jgi:hypothetical protein